MQFTTAILALAAATSASAAALVNRQTLFCAGQPYTPNTVRLLSVF